MTTATAWWLIFAVVAVLSVVFFRTWHRVLRFTVDRQQQAIPLCTGRGEEQGADIEV